jgi:hypothetical protein
VLARSAVSAHLPSAKVGLLNWVRAYALRGSVGSQRKRFTQMIFFESSSCTSWHRWRASWNNAAE